MAVTVVSTGPVETQKVVCAGCKHMLEYVDPLDVTMETGRDHDGMWTLWTVTCPRTECGKRTTVQTS